MLITTEMKLRCAERELAKRRSFYARLINEGKMTKRQADKEIELMAAIADDYENKLEEEKKSHGAAA